jgi:hypothetical protein
MARWSFPDRGELMPVLAAQLRNKLERSIIAARDVAEAGARVALEALAVHHYEPYPHQEPEERKLRNYLRARARQLGDVQNVKGLLSIDHLVCECAYEHWHRMLFARFLAENQLLIETDSKVAVSLEECKELAKGAGIDHWTLASRYAQQMLPQVFRPDDPLLKVELAREHLRKLEELLEILPSEVFTADDSLGWVYQFWQTERKNAVNKSGVKIGANEIASVTQLFTEDYMVLFLLHNTLGAWWAGKKLTPELSVKCSTEDELRRAVALPGVSWDYLRFLMPGSQNETGDWESEVPRPAAGTFEGWPKGAKDLRLLDPCMGSGHFLVAELLILTAMRMEEEKISREEAVLAVLCDNIFGLEIDSRCAQIAAFNLALAAWKMIGYRPLPSLKLACSGQAIGGTKEQWMQILAEQGSAVSNLKFFFAQIYDMFQKAPVLGSLINPTRFLGSGMLQPEQMKDLLSILNTTIELTTSKPEEHELGVVAQGLAHAVQILAEKYHLVVTNVPYLVRSKQDDLLKNYIEQYYPLGKTDLATAFVLRCLEFCDKASTTALVTPQNWLFLTSYKQLREHLLYNVQWDLIARLGPKGFQTPMWDFNIMLLILNQTHPELKHSFTGIDVMEAKEPGKKATFLSENNCSFISQNTQLLNPEAVITLDSIQGEYLLEYYAKGLAGILNGDTPRFEAYFWEVNNFSSAWEFEQSTVSGIKHYGGREKVILWEEGVGQLRAFAAEVKERLHDADRRGNEAWGKMGVAVSQMMNLPVTIYTGEKFDANTAVIYPTDQSLISAIWAFCSSPEFYVAVRKMYQKLNVTNTTVVKVPFDLNYWQKVAAEVFPNGVPKPYSSDPTQWLFSGHPNGSDYPLHVAIARLLGYYWPRQAGSSFIDCPALGQDGLEKYEDKDGIVCLPSVRGEEPAMERLHRLLATAFERDWSSGTEQELIALTGSQVPDLDEWLRNDFFEQHCALFHHRPFIWHIWDGRRRDGFHALVNYHKLAEGDGKGRKLLENLTYSYLGDWISRQQDGVKNGESGAEERLVAATELQKRLVAILEGEPPFDLFVRWKPLFRQPIGWEPDLNDGVRINIRPFMASDLPNGKKGAGILRARPNIKWDKDRGKEPTRLKKDYPWFWGWDGQTVDFEGSSTFTGERWDDCHYSTACKRRAREGMEKKEGV